MKLPTTAPAKLSRPRLHRTVPRERLFTELDDARLHCAAVHVVSQPGAGKTTLIASWLDARKIGGIWLQVDAGDRDPATFFHFMAQAHALTPRRGKSGVLPALTAEYLHDVPGFARRFWRMLFSALPRGSVIVLDNFQEADESDALQSVIAIALLEVPPGMLWVTISRRDPPQLWSPLIANRRLRLLEWEDIKLTREEAFALASVSRMRSAHRVDQLVQACEGWAAGLVLMLEQRQVELHLDGGGPQLLFGYFASLVFDRVPPEVQRFLVDTAALPHMTAEQALKISGYAQAHSVLEDLYRRRLFVHKRPGPQPVYQYHALFSRFLDAQRARMDSHDCAALALRAAAVYAANGEHEAAIEFLLRGGAYGKAADLICVQAPHLLARGRRTTLLEWIARIPLEHARAASRLLLWSGCARMDVDLPRARSELIGAFNQLTQQGDRTGRLHAAALVVNTYFFEHAHFQPLDEWIGVLAELLDEPEPISDSGVELTAQAALLAGITMRQPDHRARLRCVARVEQLLTLDLNPNHLSAAAAILVSYSGLSADFAPSTRIIGRMQEVMQASTTTALSRAFWSLYLGYYHHMLADRERSRACLDEADRIAGEHCLRQTATISRCFRSDVEVCFLDAHTATRLVREIAERLDPTLPMDRAEYHLAAACAAIGRLDGPEASQHAAAGWELIRDLGSPTHEVIWLSLGALAHAVSGSDERTLEFLAEADARAQRGFLACFRPMLLMIRAWVHRRNADLQAYRQTLQEALARARSGPGECFLRWLLGLQCELFADALEADIERQFVLDLIRKWQLPAPRNAGERWPFPIRIRTLGAFSLVVQDSEISFAGRVPRKPLAILKAVIAMGGSNIPEHALIDAVWPDAEGDAARVSYQVALHRLRKLIGEEDWLIVQGGRVSLCRTSCWLDVWKFEDLTDRAAEDATSADDARAEDLYRGPFLPDDAHEPWSQRMRERLRSKYVQRVERIGAVFERSGQYQTAIERYRAGIAADDAAEPLYRGLMRCHLALHEPAEGIRAYQQLEQTLAVGLGVPPSLDSIALLGRLQNPHRTSNR